MSAGPGFGSMRCLVKAVQKKTDIVERLTAALAAWHEHDPGVERDTLEDALDEITKLRDEISNSAEASFYESRNAEALRQLEEKD